jgi:hypothetical protein
MKKRNPRSKLALGLESVRVLRSSDLDGVVGGMVRTTQIPSDDTNCGSSDARLCTGK